MKKFLSFVFLSVFSALIIASMFSGCVKSSGSTNNNISENENRLNIVTTIFPLFDFAREITGGDANITMLIPPASEIHSYEPSAKSIINIKNADLFIYIGGESDHWVGRVLDSLDESDVKIINLMDCVEIIEKEFVEGMESDSHEHEHGHEHDEDCESLHGNAEYDEHIWTSLYNAKLMVQKMSNAICEKDADNSETYISNTEEYLSKLDVLDKDFKNAVNNGKRKTLVFGDRFPFLYFTNSYGLTYFAAFPGCTENTEAGLSTVKFLIDKISEEKIPVVLHTEFSNKKTAEIIGEETGAKIMMLHSCHNVTGEEFTNGVTYYELMKNNVEVIKEALN